MLDNIQQAESFDELQLEPRLMKALLKEGFLHPTPVQRQGLPCLLGGTDALISAPTGSGKTLCYAIPIIHRILKESTREQSVIPNNDNGVQWKALVLVPTKELAYQVTEAFRLLNRYNSIRTLALLHKQSSSWQKVAMSHILVTTPATLYHWLQQKMSSLASLQWMVVDEADLLFSFGYERDMEQILLHIPSHVQSVFVSATLDREMHHLLGYFQEKRHAIRQVSDKEEEKSGVNSTCIDSNTKCATNKRRTRSTAVGSKTLLCSSGERTR